MERSIFDCRYSPATSTSRCYEGRIAGIKCEGDGILHYRLYHAQVLLGQHASLELYSLANVIHVAKLGHVHVVSLRYCVISSQCLHSRATSTRYLLPIIFY